MKNKFRIALSLVLAVGMTFMTFGAEYDLSGDIETVQLVTQYDDVDIKNVDTVLFGSYPQSDVTGNNKEPIEWVVLERDKINREALLLSKYILDAKCYDDRAMKEEEIFWGDCTLKNWLNSEFINFAFNDDEKMRIIEHSYTIKDKSWNEKVGLMDYNELEKYFTPQYDVLTTITGAGKGYKRLAKPTPYAVNVKNYGKGLEVKSDDQLTRGLYKALDFGLKFIGSDHQSEREFGCSPYWLCSFKENNEANAVSTTEGLVISKEVLDAEGVPVAYGVRPIVWVKY